MAISHVEEYKSLRQEMLERFQRIHDTLKWGVGVFIAFLSFYLTITFKNFSDIFPNLIENNVPTVPTNITALLIMQIIIALIALSALKSYQGIYSLGTYIAVVIEKGNGGKWHRMSREYGRYLQDIYDETDNDKKKKKEELNIKWREQNIPWPFGSRWGADSAQLATILFMLFLGSISIVLLKTGIDFSQLEINLVQWIFLLIPIIIISINLWLIYILYGGIRNYREKIEKRWIQYSKDFDSVIFEDEYKV